MLAYSYNKDNYVSTTVLLQYVTTQTTSIADKWQIPAHNAAILRPIYIVLAGYIWFGTYNVQYGTVQYLRNVIVVAAPQTITYNVVVLLKVCLDYVT